MARNVSSTGWVFGGSGFLGAAVVSRALASGASVTSVARRPCPIAGVTSLELDLSDSAGRLEELLAAQRPQWLINCAALPSVAACEQDPELAERLNRDLPLRLGRIAETLGIRLVHVSTDNVFEGEPSRPAGDREEDEARPLSVYGETKRAGELALLDAEPRALVVRLPLLFGDSGGRGLGASDGLLDAVARGEKPQLFTDEIRTPLDTHQAARALVELAASTDQGLLHLAGPERLTRHELGVRILAAVGRSGELVSAIRQRDVKCTPPRPRDLTLDGTRALRSLSFCPTNPWDVSGNSPQGAELP